MSTREEIAERCITVSCVPSDFKQDRLKSLIRDKDVSPKLLAEVPGGEPDEHLRRWIVLLHSDDEVNELRRNCEHEELEFNGDVVTIEYVQSISCEVPQEWLEMDLDSDLETDGDPEPPEPPERPEKPKLPLSDHSDNPQAQPFGVSGYYHNVPGSANFMPTGAGSPNRPPGPQPHPGQIPPGYAPQQFYPSMGQPMSRPPGPGQFGPMPSMVFDQRTNQWMQIMPPNAPGGYFPGNPGGPPPPYNSTEMGSDNHPSYMSQTETKDIHKAGGQRNSPIVHDQEVAFEKLRTQDSSESHTRDEESPTPVKILVKNLPRSVDDEYLEMMFENKKKIGAGDVRSVQLSEDGTEAVVEFADPKAIDIVMQKRPIKLKGSVVEVEVYDPNKTTEEIAETPVEQQSAKIRVSNIPKKIDQEYLEMFFENKKKFGALEIVEIDFDEEECVAIIEFDDPQAVQTVLKKQPLTMSGSQVDVEEFVPEVVKDYAEDLVGGEGETVKILVTNIPPKAFDEETLEMFFENKKKFGGGEVKEVELLEEYGAAVIEFEEPEGVEIVMGRKSLTLYKTDLEVREYNPRTIPLETIEVRGDFSEEEKDVLEMYFETRKKSGGDDIVSIDVEEGDEDTVAYIKYESEQVARRVVAKGKHVVSKRQLTVSLHKPPSPLDEYLKRKFATEDTDGSDGKNEEASSKCKKTKSKDKSSGETTNKPKRVSSVKVKGMKRVKSEETVQYYFESRRSGGGPIKEIRQDDEDDNVMFITFESEDAAKAVSERGSHQVDGCDLAVSLYTPPPPRPIYEDKLLIKGLKSTTTKDCLFNFLEAKSKGNIPTQEQHGEKEGVRLVTFEKPIDFEKLQQSVTRLEGADLKIERVTVSNCIFVSNYDESLGKDTLELYFENTNRSGGGQVQKVSFNEGEGYWLVYFTDYNVIDCVLSREHTLGNKKLIVKLFVECLGRPHGDGGEPVIKMPEPFTVPEPHPQKIKFIFNSNICKHAIEKQMRDVNTTIHWPPKDAKAQVQVKLECTLTPKTKNFYKLAKEWKQNALSNFEDYVKNVSVTQVPVSQDLWSQVMKSLQEITILNPDAVAVFVEKDLGVVTVAGMKRPLDQLAKDIKQKVGKIEEEAERDKQRTKETYTSLQLLSTKMLLAIKFPSRMEEKFKDFKMKINQNKNEIVFEGIGRDISAVKLEMFEAINTFVSKAFSDISLVRLGMFQMKQVKEYIVKRLKDNNVQAVWEVCGDKLAICSTNDRNLGISADIVTNSAQEKVIPLTPANRSVTSTDLWDSTTNDMQARFPARVMITVEDMSKVIICATDDVLQEVFDVIKKFLNANSIVDDNVHLSNSITKLLSNHCKQDVDTIAKDLVSDHVQITWGKNGFKIRGNERGVSSAKTKLKTLASSVQKKDHQIDRPGLGKFVTTQQGRESVKSVENYQPCVINIKGQEDDCSDDDDDGGDYQRPPGSQGPALPPGMSQHAVCPTPDNRKIYTARGDMTEMGVDVIVNTSDRKMNLAGGLGKAISSKGGQQIKDACSKYISQYGALEEGECFLSPGGNLKAKAVIHVVGPAWQNGEHKERDRLKESVSKVMKQASVQNYKSIALPAISCGTFGFPSKVAASVIVQAIQNFFREEQDSPIEFVYLCDVKPETIEAFTDSLKTCFGRVKLSPAKKFSKPKKSSSPPQPKPRKGGVQVLPTQSPQQKAPGSKVTIGNITVTLVKGELAKEKVNVLVNTTADNLDLSNGAVSKSLLTTAGAEIQDEVKKNHPDKLQFGEIVITQGYNLNCDMVLHTALPNYDGGPAIQVLQDVMDKCMTEANKRKHTKIAFPAIGTGNLKFPKDKVATEMFTAVETFMKKYPKTSLTDVKFVVYHKDTPTIKAFEHEELRWMSGSRVANQGRGPRDFKHKYKSVSGATAEDSGSDSGDYEEVYEDDIDYSAQASSPSYSSKPFTDIKVVVKSGDITREPCDCIVNSSNEELDLSRGGVSQALLKKGGRKLADELKKKKPKMKTNHITMTGGPGLQCSNIIHIVAQDTDKDWKNMMDKCLQYAEKKQKRCIAFPALGTGMSMKAEESAAIMVTSLLEFQATKPKYVQEVRFVIFQADMERKFQKAVDDAKPVDQSSFLGKMWAGAKAYAGSWSKQRDDKGGARPKASNSVTFTVYAMTKDVLDRAIARLESVLAKAVIQKEFNDSTIQRLAGDQVMELKAIARQHDVDLKLDDQNSHIEISGIANKVFEVSDKIYEVLRDAEKIEHQKNEAKLIANLLQWFFLEVTDVETKLTKYDPTSNMTIEKAFQAGQKTVELVDSNQGVFVVDFGKMEEYPKDTPADTVQVIRRDLLKEGSFEPPATWDKMNDGENLKVVALQNGSQEYTDIETKFKASSGGNYTVQKIERVQNRTLWQQYQAKKKQLEQQNPPNTKNEQKLWHGFAVDAMDSINAHGFNRSYCGKNATYYGDGVYFAVSAKYSCRDTYSKPNKKGVKHMYYCHVLTGEYTQGKEGIRVPPLKPKTTSAVYDSVVENKDNPGMFVIFNDTQAYPEYIINFQKAK